jgi:hypothetical protein
MWIKSKGYIYPESKNHSKINSERMIQHDKTVRNWNASSDMSPLSLKADLCLVVSIQTNHTFTSLDSMKRGYFFPIRFFPHWAHDGSSFVGASVVGKLYSVQYKSIFGAPNKVRCCTCEEGRPSRLDFQRDKVKIHHVITSTQDCWSWCRTEHSYIGVQYWTDRTRKIC